MLLCVSAKLTPRLLRERRIELNSLLPLLPLLLVLLTDPRASRGVDATDVDGSLAEFISEKLVYPLAGVAACAMVASDVVDADVGMSLSGFLRWASSALLLPTRRSPLLILTPLELAERLSTGRLSSAPIFRACLLVLSTG